MTEPGYLSATRASYDTVATAYVERIKSEPPPERAMLTALAELVREEGGGRVADIGCGPGRVTAHLHGLGLDAFGIDLSPQMIALARERYPHLRFEVGTMTALELPDEELGGIVAWWSIFHTPPEALPVVFAEFARTLAPGGYLLAGFHVGDEELRPERAYGHPVSYTAYLLPPEKVVTWLAEAGLTVSVRLLRDPVGPEKWPQACLLAQKR